MMMKDDDDDDDKMKYNHFKGIDFFCKFGNVIFVVTFWAKNFGAQCFCFLQLCFSHSFVWGVSYSSSNCHCDRGILEYCELFLSLIPNMIEEIRSFLGM